MGKLISNGINYTGGGGGSAEIVEMTQAEYDALPDTKLTDGVLRAIKDEYSPADTKMVGLAECYSTTEKQVGCWVDGKPLYQKTISYDNTSNTTISINVASLNIDRLVDTKLSSKNVQGSQVASAYYSGYNTDKLRCWYEPPTTSLYIERGDEYAKTSDGYITIRYTKTTDTAGSGTWTPEGVPAHHYSTTEQVIGTYFGKTLYEKGFNVGTQSFSSGQMPITNDLSNVDEVVEYGGSAKEPRDNRNIPLPYIRKAWDECVNLQVMQLPGGTLSTAIVTNDSWYTSLENIKIWIRYTKSV